MQDAIASKPDGSRCTLTRAGLAERRAWLERAVLPLVRRTVRLPDGVLFECDGEAEAQRTLRAWIEKEAACCPGLAFALGANGEGLAILEIRGDDPILDRIVALAPRAEAGRASVGAWLRAGGLGALLSFTVLCGLPVAVAAVFGAAAAAPLARIESPTSLAVGSLVAGGLIALRASRRRRPRATSEGAGDRSPCGC